MNPLIMIVSAVTLFVSAPAAHAAEGEAPGRVVQVNDIDIHYREYGAGKPLLLLHPFGACGAVWAPFIPELARHYRVIVPDLRGHGRSSNPSNEFTHRQSAEDIRALMDRLGIRRARAIGISSGGMTLLHLATRYPERVEKMVVIGATTYFPEQARKIMRESTVETMGPQERARFGQCAARGEAQVNTIVRQFHRFKDSYDDMSFTPPSLARISAPTLIVHGDRDEFFPVAIPVEMYGSIKGSELWIVPRGDHVPIFGHRAPEFLRIATAFLARADAGSAQSPSR